MRLLLVALVGQELYLFHGYLGVLRRKGFRPQGFLEWAAGLLSFHALLGGGIMGTHFFVSLFILNGL